MTRVIESQRRRVKTTRVRSGCITCKIRHVKCDEAKPSCRRCVSSGRKCDGYMAPVSPTLDSSPQYSPSLALSKNRHERRAFQFFQDFTAHQLSGICEERFWFQCVLQTANHDTTVQHAIYAFSSFHENFVAEREFDPSNRDFALKQYEIAIRGARIAAQQCKSLFVCLVTSIIFMAIESIQGPTAFAIQLSRHSRVVFNQLIADRSQIMTSEEEFAEMEAFIQRTEVYIDNFTGDFPSELDLHSKDSIRTPPPPPPGRFSSMQQAMVYLENLFYRFKESFSSSDDLSGSIGRQRLLEWTAAVGDLEERLDVRKPRDRQILAHLKMHRLQHQILCELPRPCSRLDHDDAIWETQYDNFRKLVDLAAETITIDQPQKPSLTFNFGIVLPMMLTAQRCRDPVIRRRAVEVLRASNQSEFIWNGQLVAAATERFIEIEEAGLEKVESASDVPVTARLYTTKRAFSATPNTIVMEFISRWRPQPIRETFWRKDGCFVLRSNREHDFSQEVTTDLRILADAAAILDTL